MRVEATSPSRDRDEHLRDRVGAKPLVLDAEERLGEPPTVDGLDAARRALGIDLSLSGAVSSLGRPLTHEPESPLPRARLLLLSSPFDLACHRVCSPSTVRTFRQGVASGELRRPTACPPRRVPSVRCRGEIVRGSVHCRPLAAAMLSPSTRVARGRLHLDVPAKSLRWPSKEVSTPYVAPCPSSLRRLHTRSP